jgi:hypothetical protein
VSAAASNVSIESFFALATKAQVLTSTTSASWSAISQPPAASRPASSSESTSLRAQPRVTSATDIGCSSAGCWRAGEEELMIAPEYAASGEGRRNAEAGYRRVKVF